MVKKRRLLVTSGLPYGNGPLHLGHILEMIQMDIWCRFQNLMGHECIAVCGTDAHGTPVMLKAEQLGISAIELAQQMQVRHEQDLRGFGIHYDSFYTTHSKENETLLHEIYQKLMQKGDITTREISSAFDPVKEMFLPDRYVKGQCPRCDAADQYGDSCDACGATYAPLDLKNPRSVLSGATPIEKTSTHLFFNLPHYESFLKTWASQAHVQPEVSHKLAEWFVDGLRDWDISRDLPYFGFEIPDHKGKCFYVWLDAPMGYMASFQKYCEAHPEVRFDDFWKEDTETELYHFVGKDIIYFHALFWTAVLTASGFRTPSAIFTHGFLTVAGQKMSKSRGTFIMAETYLEHFNCEYLRYYFAAKLNSRIDDIDLNFEDFRLRVNADLVGKIVNIASRTASFIHKYFEGILSETLEDPGLYEAFVAEGVAIASLYEKREYARAVKHIMELADRANQYIDNKKPWQAMKQERTQEVHAVCTMGLHLFKILILYLKPILPILAHRSEAFLNIPPLLWSERAKTYLAHTILPFTPLIERIESEQLEAFLAQVSGKTPMSL